MSHQALRAVALSSVIVLWLSPAIADHGSDESHHHHAQEAKPAEPATHADADIPADLPVNKIEEGAIEAEKPAIGKISAGSLHTTPKVLNNAKITNDMKTALEKAAPKVMPEQAPVAQAPPEGITLDVRPAAPAQQPGLKAEPTPASNRVATPLAADASSPEAEKKKGSPMPALIGVLALALVGGYFLSRTMRRAAKP
jgi:hypothetical protein